MLLFNDNFVAYALSFNTDMKYVVTIAFLLVTVVDSAFNEHDAIFSIYFVFSVKKFESGKKNLAVCCILYALVTALYINHNRSIKW